MSNALRLLALSNARRSASRRRSAAAHGMAAGTAARIATGNAAAGAPFERSVAGH